MWNDRPKVPTKECLPRISRGKDDDDDDDDNDVDVDDDDDDDDDCVSR